MGLAHHQRTKNWQVSLSAPAKCPHVIGPRAIRTYRSPGWHHFQVNCCSAMCSHGIGPRIIKQSSHLDDVTTSCACRTCHIVAMSIIVSLIVPSTSAPYKLTRMDYHVTERTATYQNVTNSTRCQKSKIEWHVSTSHAAMSPCWCHQSYYRANMLTSSSPNSTSTDVIMPRVSFQLFRIGPYWSHHAMCRLPTRPNRPLLMSSCHVSPSNWSTSALAHIII